MKSPSKTAFEYILVTIAIFALAMLPLAARADSNPRCGPPSFAEFDEDGDGAISETEFESTRAERHAAMAESGHMMKGMASAPSFSDLDTDGDGTLSEAELTAGQQAHMQKMHAQHAEPGGPPCKCMSHGMHKGMASGTAVPASFTDIDKDGDGCISPEEFDAHHAIYHPGQ